MAGCAVRWRFIQILIPLLACFSLQADDCMPVACCAGQHVFIFRGGIGYWPNVRRLEERLNAQGFRTSTHFPFEFLTLPEQIERRISSGQLSRPLVLVGYSSGADAVCLLSRGLQKRGIPVQTAILVDPTLGIDLPANVQYCRNYYKSSPMTDWLPALRGVPIARRGAGSRLENIDVSYHPSLSDLRDTNHLTIASTDSMQWRIERLVVSRHAAPFQWPTPSAPARLPAEPDERQLAPRLEPPPSPGPVRLENRIIPVSTESEWSRNESSKR